MGVSVSMSQGNANIESQNHSGWKRRLRSLNMPVSFHFSSQTEKCQQSLFLFFCPLCTRQGLGTEHMGSSPQLQATPVQRLAAPFTSPSNAWDGTAALSPCLLLRTGSTYAGRGYQWVRIRWSVLLHK